MLIEFIRKNKDNWRELLSQEPYNLKFNECGKFTLVRYSQLSSDFSNPIVQESRGCIIDNEALEYACRPFVKFFNVSEELASPIDWGSARIQIKHDGSIKQHPDGWGCLWISNGQVRVLHGDDNFVEAWRPRKLSATPDLSGTVLPLCPIPNSALKSARSFSSVKLKASPCAALLA